MTVGKWMAVLTVVLFLGYLVWTWDSSEPRIDWADTPEIIGKSGRLTVHLADTGKGLRRIEVAVTQAGQRQELLRETYTGSGWPWQDRTPRRSVAVTLESAQMPMLREGMFQLEVTATDQPNLWLFSRTARATREVTLDLTPPRLALLSGQH